MIKIFKSIFFYFFVFWLPSIIVTIWNFSSRTTGDLIIESTTFIENISGELIFFNNVLIFLLLILLGRVHKILPQLLYGYNSLFFSFIYLISIEYYGLVPVLSTLAKYGIIEVLALAIGCSVSGVSSSSSKFKILVFIGLVLLLLAALIEQKYI